MKFNFIKILMSLKEKMKGDTEHGCQGHSLHSYCSLFKLPEYQAGFGVNALELFCPNKKHNKLLLRTCALLESLADSFSPGCVAGIIVGDRTKPTPCETKHATSTVTNFVNSDYSPKHRSDTTNVSQRVF